MGGLLRLAVGVMGNAASLLLYAAPMLTFGTVIKKKNAEGFSCVPYTVALLNCLVYTWYGLPVVSCGWENFLLVTINGLGILFELSFISIYLWFTSAQGKKKVGVATVVVLIVFATTGMISTFVVHDHKNRKMLVGTVGLVASVAMYGSPLVVMKRVIKTRSVEFMPFYLSFFSFLASSLWMAYGILGHDFFVAAPNLVGSPLGILQLLLYCKYRNNEVMEEPADKWDVHNNHNRTGQTPPKLHQLQIAVIKDDIN